MGVSMGAAVTEKSKVATEGKENERKNRLLQLLTYEVVDGKPIYYRGYRDVLAGKKNPEEVMGSSTLQWYIIGRIVRLLFPLEEKGYLVAINEAGVVIEKDTRRALDIALFRREDVRISDKYADVPPVVAIEVDVKADVEDSAGYIFEKSQNLLNFGVSRVIWILTRPRKVLVLEKGTEGKVLNWEDEFEVWEGVKVRLSDLLKRP